MRVSLKWKFGALMVGFVLTISLIILINFRTAGTVANELNRVQTQSFPQFSRVTSMEARFRTMSRLLEDTIVLGDRSFLDRAAEERIMFLRDVENLERILPAESLEDIRLIRTLIDEYYNKAAELTEQLLLPEGDGEGDESLSQLNDETVSTMFQEVAAYKSQIEADLASQVERGRSELTTTLSGTVDESPFSVPARSRHW